MNYYNRYIKSSAHIVTPPTDLLGKGMIWHWGPEQQDGFDQLKMVLETTPILGLPNLEQPYYIIETGTPDIAVGAVLM